MSKHIEVAVSPFYNGRGWTDHGTGINFEKTTLLKGHRIDLKENTNLKGIRNSIRLNHLLLLEGELPEMGEVRPEDANPAELTHKEYTTLLEGLRADGDSSELVSELESTKTELQNTKDELATANGEVSRLESELGTTKTNLDNASGRVTQLESELQTTADDLVAANGQNAELQATINSLQDELAALREGSDEGIESQSLGYTKEELEGKTVAELQQLAEDENIELTATLKAEIIQEILDAQ